VIKEVKANNYRNDAKWGLSTWWCSCLSI